MMLPDFTLEKYTGSKSRFTCPKCGMEREFTRYINARTGLYLADGVGRCNRLEKCGYHYSPKQFFLLNPNSPRPPKTKKKGAFTMQSTKVDTTNSVDFIPDSIVEQTLTNYENNSFACFLNSIFDWQIVDRILSIYCLGTWTNGECVFWQIDKDLKTRSGKIIAYDKLSGKRRKNSNPTWVHAELLKKRKLSEFKLRQCLFGEHLIKTNPHIEIIAVVESEKTAVICQAIWQSLIFVAVGGKEGLNVEKLKPLRDKRLLLFPDSEIGTFALWRTKALELNRNGFNARVSDLLERSLTDELKAQGLDLADFLVAQQKEESIFIKRERAAIIEFDGNVNRLEAERIAGILK